MREIKFKAWDRLKKEVCHKIGCVYVALEGSIVEVFNDDETDVSGRYELMQFTGLRDRNGKEIYEGDVIKFDNRLFLVFWDQERAAFENATDGGSFMNQPTIEALKIEVVGNIYENPELMAEVQR